MTLARGHAKTDTDDEQVWRYTDLLRRAPTLFILEIVANESWRMSWNTNPTLRHSYERRKRDLNDDAEEVVLEESTLLVDGEPSQE